jgi:hypothetical protein
MVGTPKYVRTGTRRTANPRSTHVRVPKKARATPKKATAIQRHRATLKKRDRQLVSAATVARRAYEGLCWAGRTARLPAVGEKTWYLLPCGAVAATQREVLQVTRCCVGKKLKFFLVYLKRTRGELRADKRLSPYLAVPDTCVSSSK